MHKWMIILMAGLLVGCEQSDMAVQRDEVTSSPVIVAEATPTPPAEVGASGLPIYRGNAYEEMNGNKPWFTEEELQIGPFVQFSSTDEYGRVFVLDACMHEEIPDIPVEQPLEGNPAGWQDVSYDVVEGGALYRRGYLIDGVDDVRNVVTITAEAEKTMALFREKTKTYIENTAHHVRIRISPVYEAMNVLCDGIILEAQSCEDGGAGLSFCVFVYNEQPGIVIDHVTGESALA